MQKSIPAKKNGKIELLRFLMSVCVVLNHSMYVVGKENSRFGTLSIAVDFFLIVSGFLMAKHAVSRVESGGDLSSGDYVKGRYRVFFPEVGVAWVWSLLIFAIGKSDGLRTVLKRAADAVPELMLVKMSGWKVADINGPTWYISALLISSVLIYPILVRLHREKHLFFFIGLMIAGYMCQNYGSPRDPTQWTGITFRANLRAVFGICYGITSYYLCRFISGKTFTKAGQWLVSLTELGIYAVFFWYAFRHKGGKYDFLVITSLIPCIALTFSHKGVFADAFDNRLFAALGRFSFPLYLSHYALAQNIGRFLPEGMSVAEKTAVYAATAFVSGVVVMAVSNLIRKKKPFARLAGLFVREN